MPASTGQLVGTQRERASVGREKHQLVGRQCRERQLQRVALAEGQAGKVGQMPTHRAKEALLRQDDGHRLFSISANGDVVRRVLGRIGEEGTSLAQLGLLGEGLANLADLACDLRPLKFGRAEQRLLLGRAPSLRVSNSALELDSSLAQAAQAHVRIASAGRR